jgi:sugar-phosphatase
MPKVSCKALLFDLDGVLIDSTPAVERVWSRWALEHGFDPDEIVHKVHGRPSIATIRELLPNADHEAENREVEGREILDVEGVILLPGVIEFLGSLPADRWTIVTSGSKRLADARIRRAGISPPTRMITADDITRGKPDPEPYLRGATLLGFAPHDCLVIEDAAAGVRSGKAAGARVIAVQRTETNESLIELGANWIVKDCRSLSLVETPLETNLQSVDMIINVTLSGVQPSDKIGGREAW